MHRSGRAGHFRPHPPASHLRVLGQEPPQPHTCVHWVRSPPSLTPACVRSGAPPASHLRALGQKQVLESGSPVQVLVLSLSSCVSLDKSFNFSVPPFPQG